MDNTSPIRNTKNSAYGEDLVILDPVVVALGHQHLMRVCRGKSRCFLRLGLLLRDQQVVERDLDGMLGAAVA